MLDWLQDEYRINIFSPKLIKKREQNILNVKKESRFYLKVNITGMTKSCVQKVNNSERKRSEKTDEQSQKDKRFRVGVTFA